MKRENLGEERERSVEETARRVIKRKRQSRLNGKVQGKAEGR
jgi:hypothetical protein